MSTPPPSFEELQTRIDSLRQGSDPGRHGAAAALPLPALPRRKSRRKGSKSRKSKHHRARKSKHHRARKSKRKKSFRRRRSSKR